MAKDRNNRAEDRSNKAMTPEQAGHLGGEAKHSCRGRECDEKKNESRDRK